MSRNNTHYWGLCTPFFRNNYNNKGLIGVDGLCDWHRDWWFARKKCIPPREIETRRGMYRRKPRYPGWSHRHTWPPPRDMKRLWQRRIPGLISRSENKPEGVGKRPELRGLNKC